MKQNLQVLVRSFFFVSLLFLLDALTGKILEYYYFKQSSGWLFRTTYSIEQTNADLLIFGASRANHHYDVRIIEDKMAISAYNTGRDGNAIFYHYAILQSILKRHIPKIAILDFSHGEFMKSKDSYDRISSLLPYYKFHPEIRPVIELKSPFEKYKLISGVYPYNSLLFQIIAGNSMNNRNRANRDDINGFVPLYKQWNAKLIVDSTFNKYDLDKVKIKYFNDFIQSCLNNKVSLYIMVSPCFVDFKGVDSSIIIAKDISGKYKIPFFDFSDSTQFHTSPLIYADESHLNNLGAKQYTNLVVQELNARLNYSEQ